MIGDLHRGSRLECWGMVDSRNGVTKVPGWVRGLRVGSVGHKKFPSLGFL